VSAGLYKRGLTQINRQRKSGEPFSGFAQNALTLGFDVLELAAVNGPPETCQNEKHQHHRQGNQQIQDVHDYSWVSGKRGGVCVAAGAGELKGAERRKAFNTTSKELQAMPRPASHAGK
jgi:hypothetical protein